MTLLVDRAGARLLVDDSLILAQVDAIARFKTGGKGRILVELQPPAGGEVAVSQESAADFRRWIAG